MEPLTYKCRSPFGGTHADKVCIDTVSKKHDPPLLYNLERDPGEKDELNANEYAHVLKRIDRVCYY